MSYSVINQYMERSITDAENISMSFCTFTLYLKMYIGCTQTRIYI